MAREGAGLGIRVDDPQRRAARGQLRWLSLSAALIALDQWTKQLIETHLDNFETRLILPMFDLVRAHNRGAAFSMFNNASGWQRWAVSALALAVSAALIIWLSRLERRAQLMAAALALILAGALGNLIDRLRQGSVVDFLQLHWHQHYFPAFNVADSSITVGATLLLLDAFMSSRQTSGH